MQDRDYRNYIKEARDMVAKLSATQCYDLYEVVNNELQKHQPEKREKELLAVQKVIENTPYLDKDRLFARKRGYRSEMALHAKAKDGNYKPNKKRV